MLNNFGFGELLMLLLLGLLVFGPDQLPKVAADAGRMLRRLRAMTKEVTADLSEEFGGDLADVVSLHPRNLIAKHLLDDEPADRPFRVPRPAADTRDVRDATEPPAAHDSTATDATSQAG